MTLREKILIAMLAGMLLGEFLPERLEAQAPGLLFGRSSATGATQVIQTNGTNALKVAGQ